MGQGGLHCLGDDVMGQVFPPVDWSKVSKAQKDEFRRVVNKVVCAATANGMGADLMLRVYMAGLYHGTLAANGWKEPSP